MAVKDHPQRQHWWWWGLMALVVVVAVVVGAGDHAADRGGRRTPLRVVGPSQVPAVRRRVRGGSQAPLAVQFRDEIRSQMRAGRTDDEILNFFADRYGQEVLLTPPSSGLGGLVWIIPVVAVAAAFLMLFFLFRRWRNDRTDVHATAADEALVAGARDARRGGDGAS